MHRLLVVLPLLLTPVCAAPLAGRAGAQPSHNVTTVTFMSYTWPGQTGLQKVFARFEHLHPSIKVKQLWLGGTTYFQKMETQAVAGQPQDDFINDPGFLDVFVTTGLLYLHDNYFKNDLNCLSL